MIAPDEEMAGQHSTPSLIVFSMACPKKLN